MESSSTTAFESSNPSSQTLNFIHQNSPSTRTSSFSSNLFANTVISNKMSLHLHSTTRRIFIGPTPTNWSYKKKSLFFSKSNYAEPHQIIKKRPSQQKRNGLILPNGIINKREKRKTFVASRDSTGPMNLSSLDYYEIISKSPRNSVEIITDSKNLVSEPQDLESAGPSSKGSDIYYTPPDNINLNPITPPNIFRHVIPSSSKLENERKHRTSHVLPSPILIDDAKDNKKHDEEEKNDTNSECSCKIDEEQTDQENNNINSPLIEDSESNDNKPKYVRFSGSSVTTKPKYQSNTIIKQNQMLVRSDCEEETEEFLRKNLRKYFNQSAEWRELMVILKPDVIELYKSKNNVVRRIYFTSKTKFSLFSSSDYTISITQSTKRYKKNFILNPRSKSISIQWYQALYELFPNSITKSIIPHALEVIIPDLDVKLQIPIYENNNNENGEGCENNAGDESAMININAEEVMNVVLIELSDITEWDDVLTKWVKSNDLRLCWKRYETLEWIKLENDGTNKDDAWNNLLKCPQFVEQTHQLQLRPMKHYPTIVNLNDGTKLTEPPPIEGYLIKITNNKGQNKTSERLYFTSQNNYLFFLNTLHASPPPPPNVSSVINDDNGIQLCDNTKQQPIIYAVSPYIQDKIIGDNNTFMKSDMKRKVKQILNASGFIDLIEIAEIKCLKNDEKTEESLEENLEEEEINGEGCPFQLLLKNGGVISLKAYSRQTRKEWVNHLNELTKYWNARLKQDARIKIDIIKTNQSILPRHHKYDDDVLYNYNWENSKSYVDPILWNWCILDGCRGMVKSGLLYHRTHLQRQFQIYHHILTQGYFLYFNHYTRSTLSGRALNRCYHKREGCINLRNCYVYSGDITEHEYYKSNSLQERSIAKSFSDQLVKIYGDGMLSYDDYKDSSFVIWKSRRKYYFSNDEMKIGIKKRVKFDIPGNFWVFRARNKIECEEWVWALNVEIERLHREENENLYSN